MNYKFKIMRNSIVILFLSLLFAGCQSADLEQMDLRPLMEEHAITGIQAVFAQEKPLSKNYNEEYFIYGEGIADTTVFQAASLSKVLVLAGTQSLADGAITIFRNLSSLSCRVMALLLTVPRQMDLSPPPEVNPCSQGLMA